MEERRKQKISSIYRLSPHCNNEVNLKIFRQHKMLYYDQASKSWTKTGTDHTSSSEISPIEEINSEIGSAYEDMHKEAEINSSDHSDMDWDEPVEAVGAGNHQGEYQ